MINLIRKILMEQYDREEEYDDDELLGQPISHMFLWKRQIQKIRSHFHVTRMLGNGVNGYVYELADGRVLKISCDDKEATMSFNMMNNPNPHFVQVHEVYKFRYTKDEYYPIGEAFCYVIIMEKVTPLNKKEFNIANYFIHQKGDRSVLGDYYGEDLMNRMGQEIEQIKQAFQHLNWGDLRPENLGRRGDGSLVAFDLHLRGGNVHDLTDFNKEIDESA